MLKRVCFACAYLLVASTAGAATLVTWQLDGTVTGRTEKLAPPEPGVPVAPPLGAAVSATFSFDPSSAMPTHLGGGSPLCNTVDLASGSVTIGGYSTAISSGRGYTQSQLPISVCGVFAGDTTTEFDLSVPAAPASNPFKLPRGHLLLTYRDLLVRGAFPDVPSPAGAVTFEFVDLTAGVDFVFRGSGQLSALDQPTPVPEPATMTLFGLGLAAIYKARRRKLERGAGEEC